jgi:hypothetical protein
MKPRYWHILLCAVAGAGILALADLVYLHGAGELPSLKEIWWLAVLVPALCGSAFTLGAGGAALSRRIVGAAICGSVVGITYSVMSAMIVHGGSSWLDDMAAGCVWRVFLFTVLSTIGGLVTEVQLPEPRVGYR